MLLLVTGLVLFLGVHSVRIVAEGWRTRTIARIGEKRWKGLYTLLSLAGFALVVWGYALARQDPVALWAPMPWARHLAALLTLVAFVLVAAAYVPGNTIKARLRHPMVVGVKVWAFAHLLANHTLADLLLFGGFLAWAILSFRAARARDRAAVPAAAPAAPASGARTAITVVAGVAGWVLFAGWLHAAWIGVSPLP